MGHTSQRTWFKIVASKIIFGDMLLYGCTARQILAYCISVLGVLKPHSATLKLKKCKWFQDRCKFLGMDVAEVRRQPAQYKNDYFPKIERPNKWGDLHILIGIFGFYIQSLPLYKQDIIPWRYILSKQPQPRVTISKGGYVTNAEPI